MIWWQHGQLLHLRWRGQNSLPWANIFPSNGSEHFNWLFILRIFFQCVDIPTLFPGKQPGTVQEQLATRRPRPSPSSSRCPCSSSAACCRRHQPQLPLHLLSRCCFEPDASKSPCNFIKHCLSVENHHQDHHHQDSFAAHQQLLLWRNIGQGTVGAASCCKETSRWALTKNIFTEIEILQQIVRNNSWWPCPKLTSDFAALFDLTAAKSSENEIIWGKDLSQQVINFAKWWQLIRLSACCQR